MSKVLTILLIALLTLSCHRKAVPVRTITVVRDSTITKLLPVFRDTTIYMPGETITYHDSIPCPEAFIGNAITGKQNTLKVSLKNGILHIDCKSDSLKAKIKLLEWQLTKEKYLNESKNIEVPVSVPTPYIPKWIWLAIGVSILLNLWFLRHPIISIFSHLITKW